MKTRIFMTMLALFAIATTAQAAITCSKPTELTATEITANSVKLSWTENGEATAWEIQYSTDADNIDEGTTLLVTENPYTLTGLTAQTTYYVRVRAVCGEGDYSNWSPTATFTTEVRGEKTQVRAVYDNPTNIVYWGEDFTLRLLDDQDETPLKNAAVTLKLNGVDYTKTTDEEGFAELLTQKTQKDLLAEKKYLGAELQKAICRNETVLKLYEKVYEDNAAGKVTDEFFLQLSHRYEVERMDLKSKISSLRKQLADLADRELVQEAFLAAIRKFMQMDTLTAPLLRELIDRIDVYETEGTGRNRTQRVVIHYRFVGYIVLPDNVFTQNYRADTRQGVSVEYLRSPVTA